jgi:hypothetical protein
MASASWPSVDAAEGLDVLRRQQAHRMPMALRQATPPVRRSTGFDGHHGGWRVGQQLLRLGGRHATVLGDLTAFIAQADLDAGLCQVKTDQGHLHVGRLLYPRWMTALSGLYQLGALRRRCRGGVHLITLSSSAMYGNSAG